VENHVEGALDGTPQGVLVCGGDVVFFDGGFAGAVSATSPKEARTTYSDETSHSGGTICSDRTA
jgi:hypothetical protein